VGALSGELLKGDPLSGAIGAVVGENVGKKLRDVMEEAGITEKHPDYEREVDRAVNIAKFTAVAAASALNKDPDAASLAASNAARHNSFFVAPALPLVVKSADIAFELFVLTHEEEVENFKQKACSHVAKKLGCDVKHVELVFEGAMLIASRTYGIKKISRLLFKGGLKQIFKTGKVPESGPQKTSTHSAEPDAPSKKRGTRTEPEAIEPTVTPSAKASRTKDKTSPGASQKNQAVNTATEGTQKPIRQPASIQDQMAMDAAKKGAGERIMKNLKDSRFKGMEKFEYKVKSDAGNDSVVHYVRDPKTGKLMDFKFKKRSVDQ
jgi:hypothetical protein